MVLKMVVKYLSSKKPLEIYIYKMDNIQNQIHPTILQNEIILTIFFIHINAIDLISKVDNVYKYTNNNNLFPYKNYKK